MYKALVILPVFFTLIIGVAVELQSIAEDTSDKALAFASDMNSAMPCATQGIPLEQCSPELFSYDFTSEQERFLETLESLENESELPDPDPLEI